MQLSSFIWQLLGHVQCDLLIFLALLVQPKHRKAILIEEVNSNSSTLPPFLTNCVINCSKKSEDNSSLKPFIEKERLYHLNIRAWGIAQFSSFYKLMLILQDWWSCFHNFFHFANQNQNVDNVQSKMWYYKVVAGLILIHKVNLPCSFFLEAIGEYHSIQEQTGG